MIIWIICLTVIFVVSVVCATAGIAIEKIAKQKSDFHYFWARTIREIVKEWRKK